MFGFHPALAPVPVQGPPLSAFPVQMAVPVQMPVQVQPLHCQPTPVPLAVHNPAAAEQMQLQQIMREMRQLSVSQQAQYLDYVRSVQRKRDLALLPPPPGTPNLRPCCIRGDTIETLTLPDAHPPPHEAAGAPSSSQRHCVIFDRAEYKEFESRSLGEDATQTPLQELVGCLLSDALDGGDVASKAGETLSSLFECERLRDAEYLCAVHSALLRGSGALLSRVMSHADGPAATKALMAASTNAQKATLLRALRHSLATVACSEHGHESVVALLPALSTATHIALCVSSLVAHLAALGVSYYGVRLLTRYFDSGAVEGMMDVIAAVVEPRRMGELVENKFGWFIYYHLLRCGAPAAITHRLKLGARGRWAALCESQYAAKVAEECLRHSLAADAEGADEAGWAAAISVEILRASDRLVAHKYGKHVFHLALISKVRGKGRAELARIKESANETYQRHVEQLRRQKLESKAKAGKQSKKQQRAA